MHKAYEAYILFHLYAFILIVVFHYYRIIYQNYPLKLLYFYILELHAPCYLLLFVRSIADHYQLKKC